MCAMALPRSPSRHAAAIAQSRAAPMPGFVQPCDPTLRARAPAGQNWLYEIKADGYRAQVHLQDKKVVVYSRTGLNWSDQFAPITQAAKQLRARSAIIDGEAVVYGATGLP